MVSSLPGGEEVIKRSRKLMSIFGNPQNKLRVIHVAGTSGKTSTSYYIRALLQEGGHKTGLTVSPHIDKVTERVQVNGEPLPDDRFLELLKEFVGIVKGSGLEPSYFELLYAFSFWVFEQLEVDYAIIETGIGGKYDATNVVETKDKLCVITDIGFDHTEILGYTLPEIASQKAGIIHHGNTVITCHQSGPVFDVIADRAKECSSKLMIVEQQTVSRELPLYQRRNFSLALAAYNYLAGRDGLVSLTPEQIALAETSYIPARLERVTINTKTVIMDGAHNPQKIEALIHTVRELYPGTKATFVLSLKASKIIEGIGPSIKPIASKVIVTRFKTTEDLRTRAINPGLLAERLIDEGLDRVEVEPDQEKALSDALKEDSSLVIITGSFYLISQLRAGKILNKYL